MVVLAVCWQIFREPYTCRLPNGSSIFAAELRGILLALRHVYHSQEKSFLILSDSLSGLRGNSPADTAAKDVLDGDLSNEPIPFSDLKPRTNKYIMKLATRVGNSGNKNGMNALTANYIRSNQT